MNGSVHARQARLTLDLRGPSGVDAVAVVLDTGFTDYLALPPRILQRLGCGYRDLLPMDLADGSRMTFLLYDAEVRWNGRWVTVPVVEAEGRPLLGMAMLEGSHVHLHVVEGGEVRIEA